jgi:hypothetical protein
MPATATGSKEEVRGATNHRTYSVGMTLWEMREVRDGIERILSDAALRDNLHCTEQQAFGTLLVVLRWRLAGRR